MRFDNQLPFSRCILLTAKRDLEWRSMLKP